jgi:hypothetical protein
VKGNAEMMQWEHEFGKEYAIPAEITSSDLIDVSWHNDAAPSFAADLRDPNGDTHDLRLWVEHPAPDMRETGGARFFVNYQPWSAAPVSGVPISEDADIYSGDDVAAALKAYAAARAVIAAEIARRAAVGP